MKEVLVSIISPPPLIDLIVLVIFFFLIFLQLIPFHIDLVYHSLFLNSFLNIPLLNPDIDTGLLFPLLLV